MKYPECPGPVLVRQRGESYYCRGYFFGLSLDFGRGIWSLEGKMIAEADLMEWIPMPRRTEMNRFVGVSVDEALHDLVRARKAFDATLKEFRDQQYLLPTVQLAEAYREATRPVDLVGAEP